MTTTQAKASPLTLIVALVNATTANATERCSGKCPVQQVDCPVPCQTCSAQQPSISSDFWYVRSGTLEQIHAYCIVAVCRDTASYWVCSGTKRTDVLQSHKISASSRDCSRLTLWHSVLQGALMQACGHMYLDEGEELSTGTARDNLLAFSAITAAGGNGSTGQVIQPLADVCNGAKIPQHGKPQECHCCWCNILCTVPHGLLCDCAQKSCSGSRGFLTMPFGRTPGNIIVHSVAKDMHATHVLLLGVQGIAAIFQLPSLHVTPVTGIHTSRERVWELTKHTLALQLVVSWPGAYGGQSGGACTGNVTWPALDSIVLLGTAASANGIMMQVRSPGMLQLKAEVSESWISG